MIRSRFATKPVLFGQLCQSFSMQSTLSRCVPGLGGQIVAQFNRHLVTDWPHPLTEHPARQHRVWVNGEQMTMLRAGPGFAPAFDDEEEDGAVVFMPRLRSRVVSMGLHAPAIVRTSPVSLAPCTSEEEDDQDTDTDTDSLPSLGACVPESPRTSQSDDSLPSLGACVPVSPGTSLYEWSPAPSLLSELSDDDELPERDPGMFACLSADSPESPASSDDSEEEDSTDYDVFDRLRKY
jgi:hypothetical protein